MRFPLIGVIAWPGPAALAHEFFDIQLVNVTSKYDLSVQIVILFIQDISIRKR